LIGRAIRALLLQDLPDQHGAGQMRDERRQRSAQIVVDKPAALHQAEIGKAVGGVSQQKAGGVLQALRASPIQLKPALVELPDRDPVLNERRGTGSNLFA
jgi:hypothetical protein